MTENASGGFVLVKASSAKLAPGVTVTGFLLATTRANPPKLEDANNISINRWIPNAKYGVPPTGYLTLT